MKRLFCFGLLLVLAGCTAAQGAVLLSQRKGDYLVQIVAKPNFVGSFDAHLIVRMAPRGNGQIVYDRRLDTNYSLAYDALNDFILANNDPSHLKVYTCNENAEYSNVVVDSNMVAEFVRCAAPDDEVLDSP